MEKVVLEDISVGGECNLFHHGLVKDCLSNESFEFYKGCLYGIIGEFGNGGAALSCGITGNTNFYSGKIFVDNEEVSIEYLNKNSWYIGNDRANINKHRLFKRKTKINKDTIKAQILKGINDSKCNLEYEEIKRLFKISDERVDRNIRYVSGERWKASAAIGYANRKKIFCYPWLNSKDIELLHDQIKQTVDVLLKSGCIVIIPTTKKENIEGISSQIYLEFV